MRPRYRPIHLPWRHRPSRRSIFLLTLIFTLSLIDPGGRLLVPAALASPQSPGCDVPATGQPGTARVQSSIVNTPGGGATTAGVTSEPATQAAIDAHFSGQVNGSLPPRVDPRGLLEDAGHPADVATRIAKQRNTVTASGLPDNLPTPRPVTPGDGANGTGPTTTPHAKGPQVQAGGVGQIQWARLLRQQR